MKIDWSYPGWKVALALCAMLTMSSGFVFYNTALYLAWLIDTHDFALATASAGPSVFFLASGLVSPLVGRMLEKSGAKRCFVLGIVVSSIGVLFFRFIDEPWEYYAASVVIGIGHAMSTLIPASTMVARWFIRDRSVAMSVATTGLSLGGITITPVCALLIRDYGLSAIAIPLSIGMLVTMLPIALWMLRGNPTTKELSVQASSENPHDLPFISYEIATRRPAYWLAQCSFAFAMCAQIGVLFHSFRLTSDVYGPTAGAWAVTLLPTTSLLFRFVGGWLLRYVSVASFSLCCFVLQGVSIVLVSIGISAGLGWLLLGIGLFGASVGNILMAQPLLVADWYGTRDYPRLVASAQMIMTAGAASGSITIGLLSSWFGSDQQGLMVLAVFSLVAAALVTAATLNARGYSLTTTQS